MATFRAGIPGAFLSLATSASVASGAVIPYDTVDWSEQWPGIVAGALTIPRDGTYLATCRWARDAIGVAATTTVGFRLNGADSESSVRYPATTAAIRGSLSALLRAAAGDVLDVRHVASNGVAATFTAGLNNLRVVRVGPERWT